MDRPPMERAMSTDVVMDIVMSYLKVQDLLNCRKVSKFWNKAASSVLRRRSEMIENISDEWSLMELQECIEQSWDFPFAGLKFNEPWILRSAGAMEFFKNYGARFTRLSLDSRWTIRLQDLAPFIVHLPSLTILEERSSDDLSPPAEVLDTAAEQEDGRILSLSSLRTLRISCEFNEDVLRQVFTAAPPSLRIECLNANYGILRALKRLGKLQSVSVMIVNVEDEGKDDALSVAKLLSSESPSLTRLYCGAGGCISLEGLMKLLISSQHTLKELCLTEIYPSQFSSECPVLSKLTTLSLFIVDETCEYVFQGRQGHKFPVLKEFEIRTMNEYGEPAQACVNFSDGLFIVPNLQKISLESYVDKDGIEHLARCFPNVIEIQVEHNVYDFEWSQRSDPTDIWSVGAFKFLEKLTIWDYTVHCPPKDLDYSNDNNNFEKFKMMNMDSFLTGIPIAICENLRKQNQQNRMASPFNEALRDSPSILQLKSLKELIICVMETDDEDRSMEPHEEPPFISMVSVWYALQMMPNLKAKFVYDYRLPSWSSEEDERDKEVTMLKAAFKLVHPCLKLEPFFF